MIEKYWKMLKPAWDVYQLLAQGKAGQFNIKLAPNRFLKVTVTYFSPTIPGVFSGIDKNITTKQP